MILKTIFLLMISLSTALIVVAQKGDITVKIEIKNNVKGLHEGEDFYLTGAFNGWKPDQILVGKIPPYGESTSVIVSNNAPGLFEYKFTRGSWETLVSTAQGSLEGPLKATISRDTTLYASINGWRDDFPKSTASENVTLLDSAFYFPSLELKRAVWIYLPKDYDEKNMSYPVIYMHDGQDLFDEATSKGRIGPLEWGVDEALDRVANGAIVVAIEHADNVQQRQNEYFVNANSRFPKPVGRQYLYDIVHTLKPFIDSNYRTLKDKKNTAMVGSSVGGLLTFYAGVLYPDVFGTLGVFSPSIWLDEGNIQDVVSQIKDERPYEVQNYFFYGGGNENRLKPDSSRVQMHEDIQSVTHILNQKVHPALQVNINPEGRHGAWYWQKAFPQFYDWWEHKRSNHSY